MPDSSAPSIPKVLGGRKIKQRERHFTQQALRQLYQVRLGLWFHGFSAWQRKNRPSVSAQMSGAPLGELLTAITRARRWVPKDTSLIEAIAAQRLLGQHGYQSTVHIGIAKAGVDPAAHAWLSYQGHVIVGRIPNLGDYTPIPHKRYL